jgi:YbbR domain-containing protein
MEMFKNREVRNQLYVFLICLLIAVFIWLSLKLTQNYTTSLKYQVQYLNLPDNQIVVKKPPSTISLQIRGKGTQLLRAKLEQNRNPLKIDLSNIQLTPTPTGMKTEMPTIWFLSQFARQSKHYDKLIDINPDTLVFRFEKRVFKKVPVQAQYQFELARQVWMRQPVRVSPDSIVVSGTSEILSTINEIETKPHDFGILSGATSMKLPLLKPDFDHLRLEPDSVLIRLPAEKFTEVVMAVPVSVDAPDSLTVRVFPHDVKITFKVSLADYGKVRPELFHVAANYKTRSENNLLKVYLLRKPAFIELVSVAPREVEYLLME